MYQKGKMNRGLVAVLTFNQLIDKEQCTPENIKLAQILGWWVEMSQSVLLIADDIMDDSETRRGQTCWHKVDDVGMMAINDMLTIQSAIFFILNKYFSGYDYYVKLFELFHQVIFITTLGTISRYANCQQMRHNLQKWVNTKRLLQVRLPTILDTYQLL